MYIVEAMIPCSAFKKKTPRPSVISKRRYLTWSSEDMDRLSEDVDQASAPKRMRLSKMSSQEDITVQIKSENREGQEKHWGHIYSCKVGYDLCRFFQFQPVRQSAGVTQCV